MQARFAWCMQARGNLGGLEKLLSQTGRVKPDTKPREGICVGAPAMLEFRECSVTLNKTTG